MNKKVAAFSLALLFLLVSPVLGAVYAQSIGTAMSGLSTGETFTYGNTYIFTSKMTGDVPPYSIVAQNQSTLQITVGQVTGSTVELQKVWTFKNGTQDSSTEYDEVNSGLTGTVMAYAGNLTAGGPLFPASTSMPWVINDTQYRAYATGNTPRLTNHISVNNTGIEGEDYSLMDLYFDQQTGICVEYTLTTVYSSNPNQVIAQHLVLTQSSVWQVSDATSSAPTATPPSQTQNPSNPTPTPNGNTTDQGFPTELIIIIVVVAVVIIVAAGLILPKGKPKAKQQKEPEAQAPSEPKEAPKEAPEKAPQGPSEEDSYSI